MQPSTLRSRYRAQTLQPRDSPAQPLSDARTTSQQRHPPAPAALISFEICGVALSDLEELVVESSWFCALSNNLFWSTACSSRSGITIYFQVFRDTTEMVSWEVLKSSWVEPLHFL